MVNLLRTRAVWTGFPGAPGYTNWFWDYEAGTPADASDAASSMYNFFNQITGQLPQDVIINISEEGAVVNDATGKQVDIVALASQPTVTGVGAGPYSAPSGCAVRWNTAGVVGGRLVKGHSFIVPLSNSAYQSDGSLASAAITALQNAANASIATQALPRVVYSRPTATRPLGVFSPITTASIPDRAAVLRSRRP